MRSLFGLVSVASVIFAQPLGAQTRDIARAGARVTALADEYEHEFKRTFPAVAELYGFTDMPRDRFDANTPAALRAWRAREDRWAIALDRIDGAGLWGRTEWVTYGYLREALVAAQGLRVCRMEWWPVQHMSGWHTSFRTLAEGQPVGTPAARRDAIARWSSLPQWLDVEMANAREGLRHGYSTPRGVVNLVQRQLEGLLALPDTAWPVWSPAARDSSLEFRAAWRRLLAEQLRPAVTRYRDFLVAEYLPYVRDTLAISAHPNGRACYRAAFRSMTSLDRPPEETFQLGEQTVARYQAEMREVGRRTLGTENVAALIAALDTAAGARFASRDEALAFARDAVGRARAAVPAYFGRLPTADVVVEPYPPYLERGSSDSYSGAPTDAGRPATFRINLGRAEQTSKARAEVTAFHETFPGHHLQVGIAQTLPVHPISRLVGSGAFVEGWARYAEGLAEEMGLYRTPLAAIARRAWPAHGMVADVGLHVMGWSPERAAAHMAEGRLVPPGTEMELMVMRSAVWPGQLPAYDTGALEIRALREEAERALGPRFDLKAFHDRVLAYGAVTLPMLRESITRWIAEQRDSPTRTPERR